MSYDLAPVYSEDEFAHWFMPRPNIIDCYVVERPQSATATSPAKATTNGTTSGQKLKKNKNEAAPIFSRDLVIGLVQYSNCGKLSVFQIVESKMFNHS